MKITTERMMGQDRFQLIQEHAPEMMSRFDEATKEQIAHANQRINSTDPVSAYASLSAGIATHISLSSAMPNLEARIDSIANMASHGTLETIGAAIAIWPALFLPLIVDSIPAAVTFVGLKSIATKIGYLYQRGKYRNSIDDYLRSEGIQSEN